MGGGGAFGKGDPGCKEMLLPFVSIRSTSSGKILLPFDRTLYSILFAIIKLLIHIYILYIYIYIYIHIYTAGRQCTACVWHKIVDFFGALGNTLPVCLARQSILVIRMPFFCFFDCAENMGPLGYAPPVGWVLRVAPSLICLCDEVANAGAAVRIVKCIVVLVAGAD